MFDLDKLIETIKERKLLSKYNLKRIGFFGSVLFSDKPNDIDILIEDYEDYRDLFKFRDDIQEITGKKADIVLEKFASPIIIYRAKQNIRYVTDS